MGRRPAFPQSAFLDVMPTDRLSAITASEIAKRVGCSKALANRNLLQLEAAGSVERGPSIGSGSFTYYALLPDTDLETGMPQILSPQGVRFPLVDYIDNIIGNQTLKLPDATLNQAGYVFLMLVASALDLDAAPEFKVAVTDAKRMLTECIATNNKRNKMYQSLIDNSDLRNYPEGHDRVRESIVAYRNSIEADNETITEAMKRMRYAVNLVNDKEAMLKTVKRIYGSTTDSPYPPVGVDEANEPAE